MILLIITYILNIIDYLFTAYWIKLYGLEIELNIFAQWLFKLNIAWVFKFFVIGALMFLLGYIYRVHKKGKIAIYILFIFFIILTIYHLIILIKVKGGI